MQQPFQLNSALVAARVVALVFVIGYPLVLAFIVHRRLQVGWRYAGYGALIFFLFQIISRLPLLQGAQYLLAPHLQASRTLLLGWAVFAAITAALFEEIGRYIGFRWLMHGEEKTWAKAVMYGIGHGGLESIVLVGGVMILALITLFALPSIRLDTLPAAQRAQAAAQMAALQGLPVWLALAGAWERLWTMPLHIAFSVIVVQVFRRGSLRWLGLAIAAHTVVDLLAVLPMVLPVAGTAATLLVEGLIAVAGVVALWVIWRLREA